MKKYLKGVICLFILILSESFIPHPGAKMSIGNIKYNNASLVVSVTLFVDDMDGVLSHINKTNVSFQEYTKEPFPKPIVDMVQNYINAKLSIKVNNQLLKQNFQGVTWVPLTMDTDNAAIKVQMTYPCISQNEIKQLTITNSLLIEEIYEQQNVLNIQLKDQMHTLTFDRDKQTIQETIN